MIIDFHTHTFPEKISAKVVDKLGRVSRTKPFTNASVPDLIVSMKEGGIDYSVNLPVMTTVDQVEKINASMIKANESLHDSHIITFGGMHPDYENYKEELRNLKENGIPGIKIHPAYQNCDFSDIRNMRIIDYASELGLIVLTHAGIDIGIYDHNYCSTEHILKVIDEVHPEKLVLAHMGGWGCWEDVLRDLAGAPVWFDTAFSLGKITQNPQVEELPYLTENLTDEQFVKLVRAHGTDKILFATDSPWEAQGEYVARMNATTLTDEEKKRLFEENARALLSL